MPQHKPNCLLRVVYWTSVQLACGLDELDTFIREIRDGGGHGSAHKTPHFHTPFCSPSVVFGSELCSPRVTTFAGEKPHCRNLSGRCLANASVRPWRHFEVSVWTGYQLPLSGSAVWRSRSRLAMPAFGGKADMMIHDASHPLRLAF